jgi:hypothetical protein
LLYYNKKTPSFLDFIRDDDEARLHNLATKTKTILKQLADEMTKRKNELSRVIFFFINC